MPSIRGAWPLRLLFEVSALIELGIKIAPYDNTVELLYNSTIEGARENTVRGGGGGRGRLVKRLSLVT